jgi:two-component system, LytTR family, response regulator
MQKNNDHPIKLPTNKGTEFFLPAQIIRLEAKSNYTKIFFTNHLSIITAKVLKEFEPQLMPLGFVRTHRSHLVNKQYIQEVCNNGSIIMNDHSTAEISKRRRAAVFNVLQILKVRM